MNRIKELAEKYNISSSYIDKIGQAHQTSDEVRKFFLEAMFGEKLSENLIEKKLAEKAQEKILGVCKGQARFEALLHTPAPPLPTHTQTHT